MAKVYGKHSTAKEIADDFSSTLTGKTVVVTGGNIGLGLESCKALVSVGARVLLLSRSAKNAHAAIEAEVKKAGVTNYSVSDVTNLKVIECDLTDLHSIKRAADEILKEPKIDILLNNAGVMAIPTRTETKYGWELQMATNNHGHFYLTSLLLDKLKSVNTETRIINVSSLLHEKCRFDVTDLHSTKSYSPWLQYGNTKLANVMYTNELAKRLKGSNVVTYSLHPGVIKTGLIRYYADTGSCFGQLILGIMGAFVFDKNIAEGAATSLYACVCDAAKVKTGAYLFDCNEKVSSALSRNEELATQLWAATEKDIEVALKAAV